MARTRVEIVRPAALSPSDRDAWLELLRERPELESPFLHPDFARAVGGVRDDARLALFLRGDRLVGVLPHHRRPAGLARPLAAPLNDVHGLITARGGDLALPDALALAGLSGFAHSGLLDPDAALAAGGRAEVVRVAKVGGDGDAYREARRTANSRHFSSTRRNLRVAEREFGPVEFRHPDDDYTAFARLLHWKRAQFERTGLHNVLGPEWAGRLLHSLFAMAPDAPVRGVLATVRFGGHLAAAQLNLLAGTTLHGWFVAYDPAFARGAPGLLLMEHVLRTAPALGARQVCFGAGEASYKRAYSDAEFTLVDGFTPAATPRGRSRAAAAAAWRALEHDRLGRVAALAARTRRRWRQIASAETTLAGRAAGAATAIVSLSKRPV